MATSAKTALLILVMALLSQCYGQLMYGYYHGKCGQTDVEELIFDIVKDKMKTNKGLVGGLTRLSFHDCFVRGCDASVLLVGNNTERMAPPNLLINGFDDIDDIKAALEDACPGVVSCADILVLATRAAIYLAGGKWYKAETGRKDGFESHDYEALSDIPGPNIPMTAAIEEFAKKGLNAYDLVILLGAHTVGIAHCINVQDRLYNYQNTGKPDPSMDPSLVEELKKACFPNQDGTKSAVFLDQIPGSGYTFDKGFYKQILANRAVIDFDQRLANDIRTRVWVKAFLYDPFYPNRFGQAMIKMNRIGVLTGNNGEVRKFCGAVNYKKY